MTGLIAFGESPSSSALREGAGLAWGDSLGVKEGAGLPLIGPICSVLKFKGDTPSRDSTGSIWGDEIF